MVRNPPVNAGDLGQCRRLGSGRSPGGGHGNPLQYPHLENLMSRGTWWATIHRVETSQTDWSDLACMHTHFQYQAENTLKLVRAKINPISKKSRIK